MIDSNKNSAPPMALATWTVLALCCVSPVLAAETTNTPLAARAKEVLRAHCAECHLGDNARADVQILDHQKLLDEELVVPEKPDDSYLYQLITSTDDDVMPPNNRPALTTEQIGAIRKWIAAGAAAFPPDATVSSIAGGNLPQEGSKTIQPASKSKSEANPKPDPKPDPEPKTHPETGQARTALPTSSAGVNAGPHDRELCEEILTFLRQSPKLDRGFLRFFSLRHLLTAGVTQDRLAEHRLALAKAINHLSREGSIVVPQTVDAAGTLMVVDIRQLGWHRQVLRGLTETDRSLDLFDLALLEYPYGIIPNDSDLFDQLLDEYIQPAGMIRPIPFVRVDWFCSVVLQPPLYHDMLQLPRTLEELESDLDVDAASNLDSGRAQRAGMTVSGVSRNNRVVERHPHRDGYYWKSHDFQSNKGAENILANPIDFVPSGGEMIFRLPNGLQAYYVSDARGDRLDAAPTSIVVDKFASDRVVRNGLGCIRCHRKGIKDFSDSVHRVLRSLPGNPGFDKRRALQLYPAPEEWDRQIAADQAAFIASLKQLGQQDVRREPISYVTAEYLEGTLSVAEAAAELGVDADQLRVSCRVPGFTRLGLAPLASSGVIRRDAWEDNFDAAATLLGIGTPIVPINGNLKRDLVPNKTLAKVSIGTNKENNFFEPGDAFRITVSNKSNVDVFCELYGTSIEGKKVRLTDGVTKLSPGSSFSFPKANEEAIEIQGGIGREEITLYASTAELPQGEVFRGKNVADRVVHKFFPGNQLPGINGVLKKTVFIETR